MLQSCWLRSRIRVWLDAGPRLVWRRSEVQQIQSYDGPPREMGIAFPVWGFGSCQEEVEKPVGHEANRLSGSSAI